MAAKLPEDIPVASHEAEVPAEAGPETDVVPDETPELLVENVPAVRDAPPAGELSTPSQGELVQEREHDLPLARATAAPGLDAPAPVLERAPSKSRWIVGGAAGAGLAAIGTAMAFYIVSQHPITPVVKVQPQAESSAPPTPLPAAAPMAMQPAPAEETPPVAANQAPPLDVNPAATSTVDLPAVQAAYQHSIQTMNALWHTLPLDVQHSLLPSQRAWIKDKAQDCRARTSSLPMTGDVQEAARLQCEMQRDQERLKQLSQYRATTSLPGHDGDASVRPSIGMAPPQRMVPNQNPADQILRQTMAAARSCYAQQNYDCAEADANTVLRIDPSSADAQMLLQAIRRKRQDALQSNWNAH
ncbi:MAG: DUF1311 domain-containing protein [Sphingomonadales bacterium]|nr:DUF1311 domain-containing protein [Sphingomonadales bacterium]MDE2171805.1 DUF1311 domain-containing protein [Sphingomonadales bacterium]